MARKPANSKRDPQQAASSPRGLRLASLVGGGLGLLGMALAILQGLAAGNEATAILTRALIAALVLAVVGAVAGAIAERVISEQLAKLAEAQAAEQEEAEEGEESEEISRLEESADRMQPKDGTGDRSRDTAEALPG